MSVETITAILTSAVIASFVSGMIAYFQFKKNNQLVYITGERQKWRQDIRNIANRIESSQSFEDLKDVLVDLKVRINAYGKNSDDVMQDSHIWDVIDKLEKHDEEYGTAKKLLILYLSMLLKMDWERSKTEVQGNGYQMAMYFAFLCTEISFSYTYFILLNFSLDFSFVLASLLLIYPVIMPPRTGMNLDKALEYFKKDDSFIQQFVRKMIIRILCYIGIITAICFFNNRINRIEDFAFSVFLFVVVFLIRFLREYRQYAIEVYYYQNIMLCRKKSGIEI